MNRLSTVLIGAGLILFVIGLIAFLTTPAAVSDFSPVTVQSSGSTQVNMLLAVSPISPLSEPQFVSPLATPSSNPTVTLALTFSGEAAYRYVLAQTALGPRPTGSEAGWATGDYLMDELSQAGWLVESQEFLFQGVKGRNIIGKRGSGPIVILGAHYDTRPAADHDPDPAKHSEWIEGANDGASGVAVLLELARTLEADKLKNEVWLAFFDAEDRGRLDGWPFSVGARHLAESLTVLPQGVIVVDMIGDADQQIYYERNSTPVLEEPIWAVAEKLGYQEYLIPQLKHSLIDDHIPFLERGIPAVDMIDFNYPYWHTTADTADKVAPISLERVGRTLEVWLEEEMQ